MYRNTILAATFAVLGLWAGSAHAAPPAVITYGGFLQDGGGNAVTTASELTFRFYAAPTGGSTVASETITVAPSPEGYFSAIVGGGIGGFPGLFDGQVYMSVQVAGDAAEMSPRIPITSVPSALAVDFSGISGWPDQVCDAAHPFVTGLNTSGQLTCASSPGNAAACALGQVVKWDGSTWACANDVDTDTNSGGTVTSVGVTAPLQVLNATTTPALSITQAGAASNGYLSSTDWSTFNNKQGRTVAPTCSAGSYIRSIAADGTPTCGTAGTVTNVTASGPLASSGGATPNITLPVCAEGQVLKVVGGIWSCAADMNRVVDVVSSGVSYGSVLISTTTLTPVRSASVTAVAGDKLTVIGQFGYWGNSTTGGVSCGAAPQCTVVRFFVNPCYQLSGTSTWTSFGEEAFFWEGAQDASLGGITPRRGGLVVTGDLNVTSSGTYSVGICALLATTGTTYQDPNVYYPAITILQRR